MDKTTTKSREGMDESQAIEGITIFGYTRPQTRRYLEAFLTVISLGFIQLLFYWKPLWKLRITCVHAPLTCAQCVLIEDQYKCKHVENIHSTADIDGSCEKYIHQRFFLFQKLKYIWQEEAGNFSLLRGIQNPVSCSALHEYGRGLSEREHDAALVEHGPNTINVKVKPIYKLILDEILRPFYFYQVYVCTVWFSQNYVIFTCCLILISLISLAVSVWETRKQSITLHKAVDSSNNVIVCRRNGHNVKEESRKRDTPREILSEDLVPGDVIILPSSGCHMECDAVLISGNCVMNEGMLTGESVPVTKTEIPRDNKPFNNDQHKRHTLFCGTRVLQTQVNDDATEVKAVVIRTGFATAKGEMVRSILYPKPVNMKFYSGTVKFLSVSWVLGVLGMVYTAVMSILNEMPIKEIIHGVLDIFTFTVPPGLLASITIGNSYAQKRLKKQGIFCLSSKYINICGSVNLMCFDKTGTLTHDDLDLAYVHPVNKERFSSPVTAPRFLPVSDIIIAMSTCHSLTIIDDELSGFPIDIKMFESIDWKLELNKTRNSYDFEEPPIKIVQPNQTTSNHRIGIYKEFPFTSSSQRMCVIARAAAENQFRIVVKGAPEIITSLCRTDSIPKNFEETLLNYTRQGYRVLSLAHKQLGKDLDFHNLNRIKRDELETDLEFLGLLVLQNSMRPETVPALQRLHEANIESVMVTGDNLLTAVKVARDSGIVAHEDDIVIVKVEDMVHTGDLKISYEFANARFHGPFDGSDYDHIGPRYYAMDGRTFSVLNSRHPNFCKELCKSCKVFARMTPDSKALLIETLQEHGRCIVGMCGDGANDCGALKTAHSGIALGVTEASIASPFNCKQTDISCVPTLIREGRCALVSSFGIFKHSLGVSWLYFIAVLILFFISTNFNDMQYVYMDLILILLPCIFIAKNVAHPYLSKLPPPHNPISIVVLLSLSNYLLTQTLIHLAVWFYVQQQPWFSAWVPDLSGDHLNYSSYQNTVIFNILSFGLCHAPLLFSQGAPYRRSILSNKPLSLLLFIFFIFNVVLTVHPGDFLTTFFQLRLAPSLTFRCILVGIAILGALLSLLIEDFFINGLCHQKLSVNKPHLKPAYIEILKNYQGGILTNCNADEGTTLMATLL